MLTDLNLPTRTDIYPTADKANALVSTNLHYPYFYVINS